MVEQVRGQPELEEEEMGVSAHVYKPVKSYTGKFKIDDNYNHWIKIKQTTCIIKLTPLFKGPDEG